MPHASMIWDVLEGVPEKGFSKADGLCIGTRKDNEQKRIGGHGCERWGLCCYKVPWYVTIV
jgi:hypothetical protein